MDGLDLIPIVPNVLDYRLLAFANIDAIRNSGMYQGVWHVAPPSGTVLQGRETFMANLVMRPNTIIIGIKSVVVSGDGSFTYKVYERPGSYIVDSYVGIKYGSDNSLTNVQMGNAGLQNMSWLPLQDPCPVVSGRITVELSSQTSNTVTPQVVLICVEPKVVYMDQAGRAC